MKPIIRVENLSKQYRIGQREPYQTFRDAVTDALSAPFRWMRNGANGNGTTQHSEDSQSDFIWALAEHKIWAVKSIRRLP